MKLVTNYICLVDSHRSPERMRNTAGRYRVVDKNSKREKAFGMVHDLAIEMLSPIVLVILISIIFSI